MRGGERDPGGTHGMADAGALHLAPRLGIAVLPPDVVPFHVLDVHHSRGSGHQLVEARLWAQRGVKAAHVVPHRRSQAPENERGEWGMGRATLGSNAKLGKTCS